jgi:microcystin-dependent protein
VHNFIPGEIRIFAGMKIPKNWELCNGQRLEKKEYHDFYQIIGDRFAISDREIRSDKFRLPDFRNKVPIHHDYD